MGSFSRRTCCMHACEQVGIQGRQAVFGGIRNPPGGRAGSCIYFSSLISEGRPFSLFVVGVVGRKAGFGIFAREWDGKEACISGKAELLFGLCGFLPNRRWS
jgi:hypothetical protein